MRLLVPWAVVLGIPVAVLFLFGLWLLTAGY